MHNKFDIIMIEWLSEKISWLSKRYKDSFLYKKRLLEVILCRSVWVVNYSL